MFFKSKKQTFETIFQNDFADQLVLIHTNQFFSNKNFEIVPGDRIIIFLHMTQNSYSTNYLYANPKNLTDIDTGIEKNSTQMSIFTALLQFEMEVQSNENLDLKGAKSLKEYLYDNKSMFIKIVFDLTRNQYEIEFMKCTIEEFTISGYIDEMKEDFKAKMPEIYTDNLILRDRSNDLVATKEYDDQDRIVNFNMNN
jgi:hypothetical protein